MPQKTVKIFIIVFIIIGLIVLGFYLFFSSKSGVNENGESPWYQNFNPFGTGSSTNIDPGQGGVETDPNQNPVVGGINISRFSKITDFAVAGATFLEDIRLKTTTENIDEKIETEEIKIIISPETKEGKKEIQDFLNRNLSLKTPLVVDGNFGKLTIEAIKDFQKLKNLPITGQIDSETAPYFTKTSKIVNDQKEESKYETVPSIRYVERKNGHMYKMFLDTKIEEKISNSTIPSIYEAFFDKTGQTVIYRYLSDSGVINSFVATLGAPKGEFLVQEISNLSVSLDKANFFYISENSNGVNGSVTSFSNMKKEVVFTSPFTEWLSQWVSGQKIFLTTKPSYSVSGSIFLLNPATGTLSKIFGSILGLTTLVNNDGSLVLYSTSTKNGPELGVFNIGQHSTKNLGVYGLPEKCVWGSNNTTIYCGVPNTIIGNQYPDSWYQGLVTFDDYFIKIDTTTGEKTTIANSITETPIDATNLFLNKTNDLMFLINKKDSTLWSLDLK